MLRRVHSVQVECMGIWKIPLQYVHGLFNRTCESSCHLGKVVKKCVCECVCWGGGGYLRAIGGFRLQVVECDKFPEQTTFLVASLHPAKLEICLWLEEDEPQVNGKASHVDGKGPMRVEHCLPAVDLSSCVDLGGLVPQAAHKGHRPH